MYNVCIYIYIYAYPYIGQLGNMRQQHPLRLERRGQIFLNHLPGGGILSSGARSPFIGSRWALGFRVDGRFRVPMRVFIGRGPRCNF